MGYKTIYSKLSVCLLAGSYVSVCLLAGSYLVSRVIFGGSTVDTRELGFLKDFFCILRRHQTAQRERGRERKKHRHVHHGNNNAGGQMPYCLTS